jgi:hypothetical protein
MRHAPGHGWPAPLAGEDGFTIVEGVVASTVLVIGLLGVLTMLTGALRATAGNGARVGATNLARELVEATRGLDFDDMTGSLVKARLQARGFGAGSPWIVVRRGVQFTVTATSCTYDDPADGTAFPPPDEACTASFASAIADPSGEDFRRTTFRLDWSEPGGAHRSMSQTTLVVNPSGGLGPRVASISPLAQTITSNVEMARIAWQTATATTLHWVVDDGASSGDDSLPTVDASGQTTFTTTWAIGTSGTHAEVLDGSYQVTGQPFGERGIAGEARRANVVLNRRQPYAPPSLAGGHNTRLGDWLEFEWLPGGERDIVGYRVMWAGLDLAVGADDTQVCPAAGDGGMLAPGVTSCVDRSPHAGAGLYYVVAIDRDRFEALRDGDPRMLTVAPASARPSPPSGDLTIQTVAEQPRLTWHAPSSGGVSFYRIYRDGVRYDRVLSSATSFTDGDAGRGTHRYWVTAVDATFNESTAVGPITWSP